MWHRPISSQGGSATAEFVMVLPVVTMIIAISLGAMALQLERLKLVSIAATVSRALARGEPQSKVELLIAGRELLVTEVEGYLCVEIAGDFTLPALPGLPFSVSDRECARKLGL